MAKFWKFLSVPIVVAVCLGLLLVPVALPGQVAVASGNVTVAIEPSTTHVAPGDSFTIDAVVDNPSAMPVAMHAVRLNFDPDYFTVDSVTKVTFPNQMAAPTIDNVNGHVDYDPCMPTGTNTTDTHIVSARISCTAGLNTGVTSVSWVYNVTSGRLTKVTYGISTDYLEGGNMSLMFNGTVKVGTPKLTVNVSPAGKGDVKVAGVTPSTYPYDTTWDWDVNVNLEAVNSTAGWAFDNWSGDVADPNSTSTTVTMDDLTKNVTANFVELDPAISVSPSPLPLTVAPNATGNTTYSITNSGGGALSWNSSNVTYGAGAADWLTQNITGGNLAANVSDTVLVTANATGLAEGTYNATINITGNSSVPLLVTLTVGVPAISVSPTSLSFTTNAGENPADQTLEVWNSGSGTLDWTLTDDAGWLSESSTSGNSTGVNDKTSVTVSADVTGLGVEDYSGTITITAPGATNTPQSVSVSLHIEAAAAGIGIPGAPEVPAIEVEPASLSASSLSISPQQVEPGQEVTISISVANTGGKTGSYNAVLYINEVVEDSQSVSVAGGTTKNVIFTVSKSGAGVYDVSLAGQNGQFEVVSTSWFGGGLGTGGIIAIVLVVIALIVALVFILRGTTRPE